jgi:hypothetical protein
MPTPWVSPRHDQLIPFNKAVNEKGQLEKGLEEEEEKKLRLPGLGANLGSFVFHLFFNPSFRHAAAASRPAITLQKTP